MQRRLTLWRLVTWAAVYSVLQTFASQPSGASAEPSRLRRFIYNCDADNMFIHKQPPMKPADVYGYVDEVAEAGVTTFFMSPNYGMVMNFPSQYARLYGEASDLHPSSKTAKEDSEKADRPKAALNLRGLLDAGHDPLGIIVDRAHEKKMEFFISFRLNEVHCVDSPDVPAHARIISDFWHRHPQWHIGTPGDDLSDLHKQILGPRTSPIVGTWLPGGLDFAVKEVRQRRMDQLRECCERYDIDGLDLDFQRFPIYFKYGEERKQMPTMTRWMGEVRAMTDEVGKKRGRPIQLSVRIMARPEENLGLGLDPVTWAREGLVDFVVVSHYLHNNFPLPVKEYRRLLPGNMPLYASIEVEPKAETYRSIARQLYQDGVDGLMMFNYFTCRQLGVEPDFSVLKELGDPATIEPVKD
jgi:hypothetical protein